MKKLTGLMDYAAVSNVKISAAPVCWHIDHTLITANVIVQAIENSNPAEYHNKASFAKWYVFIFNKIPGVKEFNRQKL